VSARLEVCVQARRGCHWQIRGTHTPRGDAEAVYASKSLMLCSRASVVGGGQAGELEREGSLGTEYQVGC
jgi:hypothetical protein